MPVSETDDESVAGIVGSISERGLLERAYRDPTVVERTVGEVMDRPLPTIDLDASLDDAFQLLSEASAVLALADGRPAGVVTKLDLLEYLAHRREARAAGKGR
jgi:cystathionine beta-synthase